MSAQVAHLGCGHSHVRPAASHASSMPQVTTKVTTHVLSQHPLGQVCSSQMHDFLTIFYSYVADSARLHAAESMVSQTEAGSDQVALRICS